MAELLAEFWGGDVKYDVSNIGLVPGHISRHAGGEGGGGRGQGEQERQDGEVPSQHKHRLITDS